MTEMTEEITEAQKAEVLASLELIDLYEEIQNRAGISVEARAAADIAKSEGKEPCFIVAANRQFVYRPLGRKEWRHQLKAQNEKIAAAGDDIVSIAEIKEDAKEEMVKSALIYTEVTDLPAGVVEVLADAILLESGFGPPESEPIRL
jgi:peptidyl-tRNA hydrolase